MILEPCRHGGCEATSLGGDRCIEHAPLAELASRAAAHREQRVALDCSDATISAQRLQLVLEAIACDVVPGSEEMEPTKRVLCPVHFDRATFADDVSFDGFDFRGPASFDGARFSAAATFVSVIFGDHADFDNVVFDASAQFTRAIFQDHAGFESAEFRGHARFDGARFRSYADFNTARFGHNANFTDATFQMARRLGPLVVAGQLVFDECVFAERVHIEAACTAMSARAATFADGAHMRLRWGEVALDNADFARASSLTGVATAWPAATDLEPSCLRDARRMQLEARPRLVTLRGAQVAGLSLSNVDLRACRFFGAHDLHLLSIEASCCWPRTPAGWRRFRHSDRETIAEEHHWRGWTAATTQEPDWLEGRDGHALEPAQLAGLYRALRKAREDHKDQAGAGDLYYGEMEMRRKTSGMPEGARRGRARLHCDRGVLSAYWILSSYGLKAGRALLALLLVVIVGSYGLHEWGFRHDPSVSRALLYSLETTSSLFRTPTPPAAKITQAGELIQMATRLLSPLLIGLALLAIRARVRR